MGNIYAQRIDAIRSIMKSKGIDAMVITGSDPHNSEYPAPRWKQVEWVSGFTGEAGDLVITADHAGLWTDTRYFIQAVQQLAGTGVELHKTRVPEQVLIPEWLANVKFAEKRGTVVVAVDGLSQPVSSVEDIKDAFIGSGRANAETDDQSDMFKIVDLPDFMDQLWQDRPAVPSSPIITLGEDTTGESRMAKIVWLRHLLEERKCDAILITALDEIAWLLNVRGSDIEYNPVVMSYLLVTPEKVDWFVKKPFGGCDTETRDSFAELQEDGINILNYDDVSLAFEETEDHVRLLVDPSSLNYHIFKVLDSVSDHITLVRGTSPIPLRKALKNNVEIEGMKEAHFEDGLAMEKFLYWLETSMAEGKEINEWDAACKLNSLRAEIVGYRGNSFETISAYGPDAALPHFVTPSEGSRRLEPHGLYLCDSGGQYLYGTTDITRTVPLGPCTEQEKTDYTLALKGHIALAKAVFPQGTAGCQIDYAARCPLWQFRRNFGHGTGHGVGFFLNVHEGPQDIRQNFNRQPILPGMINSDEPGIYIEGEYGIRHESLLLCVRDRVNEFGSWLSFETLTLCHMDTSVIVPSLMTEDEMIWLNAYNAKVYETLAPHLPGEVAEWLERKTRA